MAPDDDDDDDAKTCIGSCHLSRISKVFGNHDQWKILQTLPKCDSSMVTYLDLRKRQLMSKK